MQAIVNHHKKAFLYQGPFELDKLNEFIRQQFPRIPEAKVVCATPKGENIEIKSNEDLNEVRKMFEGQNFVKFEVQGESKHHRGHHHHHHKKNKEELETPMHPLKEKKSPVERKTHVLAKIYGGEPQKYVKFVEANPDLKMGETIKKFAEQNGVEVKQFAKQKRDRCEKRRKILSKIFGGEQYHYEEFVQKNKDLKVGQVIKKYAQSKQLPAENLKIRQKKEEQREKMKIEKLARFFNKSEEQYVDFVKQNPDLCFKKLLLKMGVDKNSEALKEFNKKEKQLRKEVKVKSESKPKRERGEKKERHGKKERYQRKERHEKKNKSSEKSLQKEKQISPKRQQMRTKGKILLQMKELFGNEDSKAYYKFIEENFELGEEQIIQKWIQMKQ